MKNKVLLQSTGNCIQYSVINHNGMKENIYMYNGVALLYRRNSHNTINQLYFSKI